MSIAGAAGASQREMIDDPFNHRHDCKKFLIAEWKKSLEITLKRES